MTKKSHPIKNIIITPFFIAMQFMTVVPIHLSNMPTPKQNALSVLYYPMIGLFIGGLLVLMAYVLSFLSNMALSAMLLALWVYLTGGLHLDGLADMSDGVVGGFGDRQRMLDIMKDPSTGAMGVIVLVVVMLLKFGFIYSLVAMKAWAWLLVVPVVGRMMALVLFLGVPYVRVDGIGKQMSDELPKTATSAILALWAVAVMMFLGVFHAYVAIAMAMGFLMFAVGYCRYWQRRIGGVTGDVIGGAIELSEMVMMGILVTVLSFIERVLM